MKGAEFLLTFFGILAATTFVHPTQGQFQDTAPIRNQGQEYIYTGPADTQYIRQTHNEFDPFQQNPPGFQQIDSYLPQRDLQTSDLPFHLQQSLPQYRLTTKTPPQYTFEPQYNFRSSQPAPFRPQQNIVPSTHRPNYSHLFSHSHNRNPSQTETFLGEITLQSPAELPPRYNEFKPSSFNPSQSQENVNQNLDFTEKPNQVQGNGGSRASFLNHRTRIFAPDSTKKATLVKDYFVNNNGDVFITTKTPFVPKPTPSTNPPTTVERRNPFSPATKPTNKPISFNLKSNKKPFVPKDSGTRNGFDLESLLEEPIKNSNSNSQSDDVVEIIKTKTTEPTTDKHEETATDYEYDTTIEASTEYPETEEHQEEEREHHEDPEEHNISKKENEPQEEEDEVEREHHEDPEEHNISKKEKDPAESDSEEADYISEEQEPEEQLHSEENNDIRDDEEEDPEHEKQEEKNNTSYEVVTTKPSPGMVKDDNFHKFLDTTAIDYITTEQPTTLPDVYEEDNATRTQKTEALLAAPELVVSVVTTKSVVNNTVIPSVTPLPAVTIQMSSPDPDVDDDNGTWVVVASVQTSRSVSGARYLPSSNVEQDEKVKLLNEESEEVTENTTEETETTTLLTTTKQKTSTESLIDKLDRVQSDLSSSLLNGGFKNEGNNIAVITENMSDKIATTMLDLEVTSPESTQASTTKSSLPVVAIRKFSPYARPSTTKRPKKIFDNIKQDDLTGLLPPGFQPRYQNKRTTTTTAATVVLDEPQSDEPHKEANNSTTGRSSGNSKEDPVTVQDISAFLPPGFKSGPPDKADSSKLLAEILGKVKQSQKDTIESAVKNKTSFIDTIKKDDISAFLPPGYKSFKTTTTTTTEKSKTIDSILAKAKPVEDISALLPPGYKPTGPPKPKGISGLLAEAKPVDISAFLPPGYKARTTQKPLTTITEKLPPSLLPPGYKLRGGSIEKEVSTTTTTSSTSTSTTSKPSGGGFKVVFPSRPGGSARKSVTRLTTPKSTDVEEPRVTPPTIQKGWPSRATTEFTGWPTPSTTPISIEKLLEAARTASTSTTTASASVSTTSTTTTTTTTTTTPKPTTPGICKGECDLAGTIKLIGGAKWAPELLDRNTKEWQILANEVQTQLESVFGRSNLLNKWYKKIRIDGFSEGSVLVDYLVELNDLGRQIDTTEIKKLFHDSLDDALTSQASNREGKAFNETKLEGKLSLGNFIVDPKYTDFIVLPKQVYPTVGYAEDNVLLPQWAIAVIVIGLASLLFVIIFGVTVLVNRQKNAKKKAPVPLTEDMLNELNKNHMGGFDNYGAEDLYNMEDVWNDRGYDPKLAKKRSSGSIHDNSMSNLYDSWRSEWNGYYYNAYYGNNPGSSHGGYGRRRSDYDTNF